MNKLFIYALICSACVFASCKSANTEDSNKEIDTELAHNHSEDVIILSKEKALKSGVVAQEIHRTSFQNVIKVGGKLIPKQNRETIVVATTAGKIQVSENVTEGMSVLLNQSLMAISSKNMQDGDPILKAKITYEIAKGEYDRVEPLVKEGIVTQKDFSEIKKNYENARITYESTAKGYGIKGLTVKANQKGYIKEVFVQNGAYVSAGDPLLSIIDNNELYLEAEVPTRYFSELKDINTANFKMGASSNVYNINELDGKLISYSKSIKPNQYLLPVIFSFKNINNNFIPGSYTEVFLLSKEIPNVISLPYSAITEQEGLHFVYKQICTEEYEKVTVTLGMDNGKYVVITSGINEGDLIVTEGAQQIKLASASNSIPAHSHEH